MIPHSLPADRLVNSDLINKNKCIQCKNNTLEDKDKK